MKEYKNLICKYLLLLLPNLTYLFQQQIHFHFNYVCRKKLGLISKKTATLLYFLYCVVFFFSSHLLIVCLEMNNALANSV